MLRRLSLVTFIAVSLAACGSSGTKSGTSPAKTSDSGAPIADAGGTLDAGTASDAATADGGGSLPFTVGDQIFFGSVGDAAIGVMGEVQVVDFAGACALQQASDSHKQSSQYVDIVWPAAISVGTFTVGVSVFITLHQRDATCALVTQSDATAGSITVTSIDATTLIATFTADVPGAGTIAASIDAAFCDTSTSTGATACVP